MIVAVLVTIDSLINTQNPIVFAVINQIQISVFNDNNFHYHMLAVLLQIAGGGELIVPFC
ncbi:hypothetical protein HmCmsJML240_04999 [Escherichia coli]|nr:hypothetical protein HmCmsJML240_04999 [Escherichia coli]